MAPAQLLAPAAPHHYPLPRDQETSEPLTSLPTPFPPTPHPLSHTSSPSPQDQSPYPHTCLPPRSLQSAFCTTSLVTGPPFPTRTHQRPTQLLCADARPGKPACTFGAWTRFSTSFFTRPLPAHPARPSRMVCPFPPPLGHPHSPPTPRPRSAPP